MHILKFIKYLPGREHSRFRRTLNVIDKFSESLINEKTEGVLAGKDENDKDILSILSM